MLKMELNDYDYEQLETIVEYLEFKDEDNMAKELKRIIRKTNRDEE